MPNMKLPYQNGQVPALQGGLALNDLIGASDEKVNSYRKALDFHGIQAQLIREGSHDELVGDCPFYDCPSFVENKPDKFRMRPDTGQWRCFVCGRDGNVHSFVREVHRNSLEQTTERQLLDLVALRKGAVGVEELKEMKIAFNPNTKEWSIPAYSLEGKLSNLYIWRQSYSESGKPFLQLLATPGLKQLPYGLNRLRSGTDRPILLLEGHFDYLAMMTLLRLCGNSNEYDLLASPGAFPKGFAKLFNGRKLMMLGDNDAAGNSMMNGVIAMMKEQAVIPTLVKRIVWPKTLPQKFDVSDVITSLPNDLRRKK